MKRKSRKLLAVGLCLVLTICLGTVCAIAATSGSIQLTDGGCTASGSSSIGGNSASAGTQGSMSDMQVNVSGHYEYYYNYAQYGKTYLRTDNKNNGNSYHAGVDFNAGYDGRSKSLDSTHSFTYGTYNDSRSLYVEYH